MSCGRERLSSEQALSKSIPICLHFCKHARRAGPHLFIIVFTADFHKTKFDAKEFTENSPAIGNEEVFVTTLIHPL